VFNFVLSTSPSVLVLYVYEPSTLTQTDLDLHVLCSYSTLCTSSGIASVIQLYNLTERKFCIGSARYIYIHLYSP